MLPHGSEGKTIPWLERQEPHILRGVLPEERQFRIEDGKSSYYRVIIPQRASP